MLDIADAIRELAGALKPTQPDVPVTSESPPEERTERPTGDGWPAYNPPKSPSDELLETERFLKGGLIR